MKSIIRLLAIVAAIATYSLTAYSAEQPLAAQSQVNSQAQALAEGEKLKTKDQLPIENEFDDSVAKRVDAQPLNIIESITAPDARNYELIYVNMVSQPDQQNRQTLVANATLKTVEETEDGIRFALALSEINNKVESTRNETINQQLEPVIFYWEINKDGEFLSVDLLGLPEESPLNVIEKILTSLSYSVTKSLQQKEINGFDVEFAFRFNANDNILWKRAEALEFESQRDLGYQVNSNKGKAKFELDGNGFFTEAVVIEDIAFTVTNRPAEVQTKLKFKASEKGASIEIPDTTLAADFNRPEGYEEQDVQTASVLEIKDDGHLQELINTKEEWDFFEVQTVGKYLSENGYGVLQALLAGDLSQRQKSHIFAGLQAAESPESQEVLVAASRDPSLDEDDRLRAILALGKLEEPTQETISALQNLSSEEQGDVSNTAYLNLGLISQKLPEEKRDEVVQFLNDRLNAAANTGQEWVILSSIGNAGENVASDTVKSYFDSDDVRLRQAAAKVLLNDAEYAQDTLNHVTSISENNYQVVAEVRKHIQPSMLKESHLDQLESAFNRAKSYDKLTIERFKLYTKAAKSLGQLEQREEYVRRLMDEVKGPEFTVPAIEFLVEAKKIREQAEQEALQTQ